MEVAMAARQGGCLLRPSNGIRALLPSSAKGWLNGGRSPVSPRLGGGAAPVHQGAHRGKHGS